MWPTHDDDALKAHGLGSLEFLYDHFRNLDSLSGSNFDFEEAKNGYLRLKFDMRSTPIFNMDFKKFWVRIFTGFDKVMRDYKDFNVITRVVLLLVIGTSICETGYSALNRIQTKARTRLLISTIRDVLTTQQHGPKIKAP